MASASFVMFSSESSFCRAISKLVVFFGVLLPPLVDA